MATCPALLMLEASLKSMIRLRAGLLYISRALSTTSVKFEALMSPLSFITGFFSLLGGDDDFHAGSST